MMKRTSRSVVASVLLPYSIAILSTTTGLADQLVLESAKDNTLYEDQSGSLSNGAGVAFFAGVTGQNRITRAVLAFDLSAIPAGSTITSAVLELNQSNTNNISSAAQTLTLHRLLRDWGEGSSNASSGEGGGAQASTGDATWAHTFFNTALWDTVGGDFSGQISATTQVGGNGKYTWGSSQQLVADVQGWIDDPANNFGWVIRGNENSSRTAKRFDSRNTGNAANRPRLTVNFDPPVQQLTEKLHFAQFADGLGLTSAITLVNLSATEPVTGRIEISGDDGTPLSVDLNGEVVPGEQTFSVPPGGSGLFSTDGAGDLQTGGVTVSSDLPLSGVILFSGPGLGVAGVGSSELLGSFLAPMEMDVPGGIRTGIAIINPDPEAKSLLTELRDPEGNLVATGTFGPQGGTQPLPGGGHIATFLDDPQFNFQGSPDLSSFRGILKITASGGQVAATVIRQSSGEFATLPVAEAGAGSAP